MSTVFFGGANKFAVYRDWHKATPLAKETRGVALVVQNLKQPQHGYDALFACIVAAGRKLVITDAAHDLGGLHLSHGVNGP